MSDKKYLLFLGCTIPARGRNYEISGRRVAEKLGIELVDNDGFSCCGFPVKNADSFTCLLMAARNIAIAEKEGLDICAFCSACAGVLIEANSEIKHNPELREKVNKKLAEVNPELKVEGKIEVKHFARILYEDVGVDAIKEKLTRSLDGFRFAAHYGCHYLKPSETVQFEDPEAPRSLDDLIEVTGAESVNYCDKKFCCGGALLAIDTDTAWGIGNHKLEILDAEKVDGIVLVCPFCAVMYDDNQRSIAKKFEKEYAMPVLYLPQLLGIAMGFDPKTEAALRLNKVKPKELLAKLEA